MRRALRAVSILAGVLLGLALAVSTTGLLYAARGLSLPGPVMRDALPLDELPPRPHTRPSQLALARVTPVASALVAPLGLALVVVARGLARRKRRACHVALLLLLGLAVLHASHRFDYGAVAAVLVALVLVAR